MYYIFEYITFISSSVSKRITLVGCADVFHATVFLIRERRQADVRLEVSTTGTLLLNVHEECVVVIVYSHSTHSNTGGCQGPVLSHSLVLQ